MIPNTNRDWLSQLEASPTLIQKVPLDILISQLIRRDVTLNEIIATQVSRIENEKLISEQQNQSNRQSGPAGPRSESQNNPENEFYQPLNNKDPIDIKQQTLELLAQTAYNYRLISKNQHLNFLDPKVSNISQHPYLAYMIASKLPNLYYVSDVNVPFDHHHRREQTILPALYRSFLLGQGARLIPKWKEEFQMQRQRENIGFQEEIRREELREKQKKESEQAMAAFGAYESGAQGEYQSDDEDSMKGFIVSEEDEQDLPEDESEEEFSRRKHRRRNIRCKKIEKTKNKKSRMRIGDEESSEQAKWVPQNLKSIEIDEPEIQSKNQQGIVIEKTANQIPKK